MKRSYVVLVLRLSRRSVNEICAGDYRFDGCVSRAGIPDAGDREFHCGEEGKVEERYKIRKGVCRVLHQLSTVGSIAMMKQKERGASACYVWKKRDMNS